MRRHLIAWDLRPRRYRTRTLTRRGLRQPLGVSRGPVRLSRLTDDWTLRVGYGGVPNSVVWRTHVLLFVEQSHLAKCWRERWKLGKTFVVPRDERIGKASRKSWGVLVIGSMSENVRASTFLKPLIDHR